MNERYLFRAWDAKLKTMFYIHELKYSQITNDLSAIYGYTGDTGGFSIRHGGPIDRQCATGQRYFLMQCTGLRDKNGTLIFEGDVLYSADAEMYFDVKWWRHGWYFNCTDSYEDIEDSLCCWADDAHLVGNIHDNPELVNANE